MSPVEPVYRLETFAEIGSTNQEGMARLAAGETGPLWLSAERQTAGRGREGRTWASPTGNLSASFVTRLTCDISAAPQVALVAGVALVASLAELAPGLTCRLKWPNDILLGDAKLAGILVESTSFGTYDRRTDLGAVIGFGVNLASAPDVPDRATTALRQHGFDVTPATALTVLARHLSAGLAQWNTRDGFAVVRDLWLAAGPEIGTPLTVRAAEGARFGRFAGLAHDGALLLQDNTGVVLRITFGDVEGTDTAQRRQ